jgi:outer membrane protein OmpA-like peptidoglycan-associated protein
LETLSGIDLSGVRVHRNSSKTRQINALAYTQGQDIHVDSGQEKHLAHEGWHVVQQMQGRVKPTIQTGGVLINDDKRLEHEADVMGEKALQVAEAGQVTTRSIYNAGRPLQRRSKERDFQETAVVSGHSIIQRYANCSPPRMSGKACPSREKNERQVAHGGPMVFLPQLIIPASGEKGALIANFNIGSAVIKSNLGQTIYWKSFLTNAQTDKKKWRIEGFSDCQGSEAANQSLREQRAKAVLSILPAPLQARITSATGGLIQNCITENSNAGQRTLNRSVALLLVESSYEFTGETIEGELERNVPATDGCSENQRERLGIAFPLARRMGENAKAAISRMKRGSPGEALLQKFFGSRAFDRRWLINQGYTAALRAISGGPTYKCVSQGTAPCDSSTTSGYVGAHAIIFGSPVVVCAHGFNVDNIELADTILHEASHVGDLTNDLEYCSRTNGCSLETVDEVLPGIRLTGRGALNNADSYARFASELFRR